VPITPDNLPDDPAALKRIIAAMSQDALTAQAEIARLKFQLARYRRAEFGRSSEKLTRGAEQLELALEALETDQAERLATASPTVAAVETVAEAQKPARRPLPPHLAREDLRHPAPRSCPSCGGALRKIADEISETLDYVPSRFKVVRHIREKLSCRVCERVVAAPWHFSDACRRRTSMATSSRRPRNLHITSRERLQHMLGTKFRKTGADHRAPPCRSKSFTDG
jgi:transposase